MEEFAAAIYPDRRRVLGRTLQPLTIGHLLVLTRLRHPLVLGEGRYDAAQVGVGVAVCCRSAARAEQLLRMGLLPWMAAWLGLVAVTQRTGMAAFARYLVAGTKRPDWIVLPANGEEKSSGLPQWAAVYAILQSEFGRSEEEAAATRAELGLWLAGVYWESVGKLVFTTDSERRIVAEERSKMEGAQ